MNTSVDKSSKKRKSLGGQNNTPAKVAKLNESVKSPKAEIKKKDVPAKAVVAKTKSPKKQIKSEAKAPVTENATSPLKKFKGTKTLDSSEVKKPENGVKTVSKDNAKKEHILGRKKNFLLVRMQERVQTEGKEAVVKTLNDKIDTLISSSDKMTKTGKRTLRLYKNILKAINGEEFKPVAPKPVAAAKQEKNKKQEKKAAVVAAPVKENKKNEKPVQKVEQKKETEEKKNTKTKQPVKKVEEEEDSEEESSDEETESAELENGNEAEEDSDDEDVSDEEDVDEEEDDDDDEEEDDEEEDKEEEEKPVKKAEPKKVNEKKSQQNENAPKSEKKSRYVLFIGNLAYDTTKDELKDHFKKIGEVVDVRIPLDRESNKPRGFAYVELGDAAAYQKSLDLNGSQLKNRKIKVEYTQEKSNDENRSKNIKAKNFKLHAMRKQGQQGSPNKGQKGSPFKGQRRGSFKGKN